MRAAGSRVEAAKKQIEERLYRDAIGEPIESPWKKWVPLFTEHGFAKRVIRKRLKLPTPLNTTDREVLEQRIFPQYCADQEIRDVLFIGCDSYTAHYQREYFSSVRYVTMEPDPQLSRYGAEEHVIAPLEELGEYYSPNTFDLIICNGVFGWGLDRSDQCEQAFMNCHACLREGGQFLLGWDDVPRRKPVPLEKLASLKRFRKRIFPEFGTWRFLTDTPYRHTYDFYRK